ncbi:MAG: hypothetical protein R3359_05320 [Marinirhabdus sp.]|nr:hypothetical protein [Marinirhabdus sp.]
MCASAVLHAQKRVSRSYTADAIQSILMDANGVHSLRVIAMETKQISLEVYVEGEMAPDVVVNEKTEGNSMSLGFETWPYANIYDDKLAAHKVLSVEVVLTLPKNKFVSVVSKSARVAVTGAFEMLYIAIEDRSCTLRDYAGSANLRTNRGNIDVVVNNGLTKAKVNSVYGSVTNALVSDGKYTIWAESIHGDIGLRQTE